ncbi:MAG: cytochrome C oxidase subunit II [Gemmatimonadetes bacterium]|nr:cytochrome C oxidase subunit II [Gemmatimonadota bacterium]
MNTGLESPREVWWKPAGGKEKLWVSFAFGWCIVLFAMMPLWHLKGRQNPSGIRHKVDPQAYLARTEEFIATYQVSEMNGIPVVEPPPGSDVYLLGRMWQWTPVLRLRRETEYTLHLSSLDVNHGFSLFPVNVNFQVVPGYDYALKVVPNKAGEFRIICNEFCGIGHHLMLGNVIVVEGESAAGAAGGGR